MTRLTLCPQFQVRSEGLLDTMTCLMDHLAERQEEETNFNFIEEKIARPLIDMGVDITFEQVAGDAPPCGEPSPRGREGSPPRPALWGGGGVPAPPRKNDQNRGEVAAQNKGSNLNFLQ